MEEGPRSPVGAVAQEVGAANAEAASPLVCLKSSKGAGVLGGSERGGGQSEMGSERLRGADGGGRTGWTLCRPGSRLQ